MNINKVSKRISIELDEMEQVINRIYTGFQKAKQNSDDYYLDGVALNLHGLYSGIERIVSNKNTLENNIVILETITFDTIWMNNYINSPGAFPLEIDVLAIKIENDHFKAVAGAFPKSRTFIVLTFCVLMAIAR